MPGTGDTEANKRDKKTMPLPRSRDWFCHILECYECTSNIADDYILMHKNVHNILITEKKLCIRGVSILLKKDIINKLLGKI